MKAIVNGFLYDTDKAQKSWSAVFIVFIKLLMIGFL